MHRDIDNVIDQIIREIPHDFVHRRKLKNEFKEISNASYFTAPEAMQRRWQELVGILDNRLGPCDSDWKKKIKSILSGEADQNSC